MGTLNPPRPAAVLWYRIYCGAMALLCLLLLPVGALFGYFGWAGGLQGNEEIPSGVFLIYALAIVLIGLVMGGSFLASFFFPRKPWAWIYGIVLISMGMNQCCFVVFLIPLLVYWVRPEVQAWYGHPFVPAGPDPDPPSAAGSTPSLPASGEPPSPY